jgi:hypothetical protein
MEPTIVRSHERMQYKRCPKQWYWHWRKGLVPKRKRFGALDLGTWVHAGLADWYLPGVKRYGLLADLVIHHSGIAIAEAYREGAPDYEIEKANELQMLGAAMAGAYQEHYKNDLDIDVIAAELPLEFTFPSLAEGAKVIHRLKPDLVYADNRDGVWLMETKTATSVRTEHLVIDDQARPYGAMAARALEKAGVLKGRKFKGIMYNFLRKALPDERETNEKGQYLNKNGTVSARQPKPLFVRHPVLLTEGARAVTLERIHTETRMIAGITQALRTKSIDPIHLPKTPHHSCPKFCDYFTMCTMEENGLDIRDFMKSQYLQRDPYIYDEDSTDEIPTFEMG